MGFRKQVQSQGFLEIHLIWFEMSEISETKWDSSLFYTKWVGIVSSSASESERRLTGEGNKNRSNLILAFLIRSP